MVLYGENRENRSGVTLLNVLPMMELRFGLKTALAEISEGIRRGSGFAYRQKVSVLRRYALFGFCVSPDGRRFYRPDPRACSAGGVRLEFAFRRRKVQTNAHESKSVGSMRWRPTFRVVSCPGGPNLPLAVGAYLVKTSIWRRPSIFAGMRQTI